jgi:hypothetical protein
MAPRYQWYLVVILIASITGCGLPLVINPKPDMPVDVSKAPFIQFLDTPGVTRTVIMKQFGEPMFRFAQDTIWAYTFLIDPTGEWRSQTTTKIGQYKDIHDNSGPKGDMLCNHGHYIDYRLPRVDVIIQFDTIESSAGIGQWRAIH